MNDTGTELRRALDVEVGRYMHNDDPAITDFALAVAVSAALHDEPLWGMLIGPPSGGKSETIRLLQTCADAQIDEVTAAGLLSWSKTKPERPVGILTRIPDDALITVSDFSPVLATSDRGGRDQLFSVLRCVYDGHLQRALGGSLGPLEWAGHITLLAACTPSIDDYASYHDALGPRWLYIRQGPRTEEDRRAALRKRQAAQPDRTSALNIARALVSIARSRVPSVELEQPVTDAIEDAAIVATKARASVRRDGYGRREIIGIASVEEPPRIAGQLTKLARCLVALGHDQPYVIELCRRCAVDSAPQIRRDVLREIVAENPLTTAEVARRVGCVWKVAERALEDFEAIGLLERAGGADASRWTETTDQREKPWRVTRDRDLLVRVLGVE